MPRKNSINDQAQSSPQQIHTESRPAPHPKNWKVTLAYDGGDFQGWQVQPTLKTIQGELAAALERMTGEQVLPQGSGRTDAGVHAHAQVASFQLKAPIPAANLVRALNRTLPESIRILSAYPVEPAFHARHSAIGKTYEYRLWTGGVCPPTEARYAWAVRWPLSLDRMQQAAQHLLGEHDFTSFAASDPDRTTRLGLEDQNSSQNPNHPPGQGRACQANRTLTASAFIPASANILVYSVTGSGFLHHMVRNLVGTLVDIGRGALAADAIPAILVAKNRSLAGPTAPARGLFLRSVHYGPHGAGPGHAATLDPS